MARLMKDGLDVTLESNGVHEDEGQSRFGQRRLIAAGSFAFVIGEIEETQVSHSLKAFGQVTIQMIENLLGPRDHLIDFLEWTKRRPVERIDRQIPRPQCINTELPFALILEVTDDGHDVVLDCLMELFAISGGVVEP